MEHCRCPRPDLWDTGDYCCCIGCGLVAAPDSKSCRKLEAEIVIYGDDKRAAPPLSSQTPFNYKKLEHAAAFRLLRLLPGRHDDEIACEIFHADISNPPDYEAVSYTWGSTTLTQELQTTEGLIKITENCLSALTDLRDETWERILWVDAICIAQENNEENNHQIPLMARIYSKATQVLIYLGGKTAMRDTEALFELLRGARKRLPYHSLKTDMAELLSLPWFSRVWILQEVAMARHAKIIIGSTSLDWRHLSVANIQALGLEATDLAGQVPTVLQISRSDRKPLKDIASLITMARSCQSTDPRDRIYALLGLVDERAGIDIVPDYTKTAKEVYTDLAAQVIKTYNRLDILSDSGWHEESDAGEKKTWLHLDTLISRIQRVRAAVWEPNLRIKSFEFDVEFDQPSGQDMEKLHNLVVWEIDDFTRRLDSDSIDEMSTASQTFLGILTDFQAFMDTLDPHDSNRHFFNQVRSYNACVSLDSRLESVETYCVALKEAIFTEAMQRRPTSLTPEYIFGVMPIEQESMEAVEENLDLPSWVPDYKHHRQPYSFARYTSNSFAGKPVAHFHPGSQNRPMPSLEVRAILVNKVQRTDWMSLQHIRLCDKWVKFRRDSQLHHTAFIKDLNQRLTETGQKTTLDGICRFSQGRRLVLTQESIAIVPASFKVGDVIALLHGGTVPYLLRPSASKADTFQLLGECYLHGIKGPQFAPNYAELLGYFKDYINPDVQESRLGDVSDLLDILVLEGSDRTNERFVAFEKALNYEANTNIGCIESGDHAALDMEQDGLPWQTIFLE